jgi:hypothetical protein
MHPLRLDVLFWTALSFSKENFPLHRVFLQFTFHQPNHFLHVPFRQPILLKETINLCLIPTTHPIPI